MSKTLYAVLKLSTDIEYIDPYTDKKVSQKLDGIAGYIPVFSSIEEAEEHNGDGKYSIIKIQT